MELEIENKIKKIQERVKSGEYQEKPEYIDIDFQDVLDKIHIESEMYFNELREYYEKEIQDLQDELDCFERC